MNKNMGTLDRTLRLLAAAVIAGLYLTHQVTGTLAIVLGIFALVFLVTSVVGFCPLYVPLRLSTRKTHPAKPAL
ncbi:MAG TPA: DUF2892 domain-containing protein [Longimicrobiales bacterium]